MVDERGDVRLGQRESVQQKERHPLLEIRRCLCHQGTVGEQERVG